MTTHISNKLHRCSDCHHAKWRGECPWCIHQDKLNNHNKKIEELNEKRKQVVANEKMHQQLGQTHESRRLLLKGIYILSEEMFDERHKLIAALIIEGKSAHYIKALDKSLLYPKVRILEKIYNTLRD